MTRPLHTPVAALLLALGLGTMAASPAHAQDEPAPAAASAPVDIGTDLRSEYLLSEPILVRFTVTNSGASAVTFADLSARPHLVRFDLTYPDGKKQSWYTTPPEADPKTTWTVSPRGQKQVLLEIPSSQRLKAGNYTLGVRIQDDAGERSLPSHAFLVAPSHPVGGEVVFEPLGLERVGHQLAWLHDAKQGYDLYLHHAAGKNPDRVLGDFHLLHLDDRVDPVLSHARPQDRGDRYVYWQAGERSIAYARLQGQTVRGKVGKIESPYPIVEVLGRGSTDAEGGLHIPVWIPNPNQQGGEVRVISLGQREGPRFRSVLKTSAKPAQVESAVDSAGNLRLLLEVDGNLDIYTVLASSELPASGKRVRARDASGAPVIARFAYVEDSDDSGGGLSILVLSPVEAGLAGQWFTLSGGAGPTIAPMAVPAGTVHDLLPLDRESYGLLVRDSQGSFTYVQTGALPKSMGRLRDPRLIKNGDAIMVRDLEKGGPVVNRATAP